MIINALNSGVKVFMADFEDSNSPTWKNCIILEKSISTKNLYDAKSEGYSFGTDLAEKELSTKNLHSIIDQFLNHIYYIRF